MANADNEVDWEVVDEELQQVQAPWKQVRFDSLPEVVRVITSDEPELILDELREQRDAIEELVDDVVKGYHNGFNKAIHNYSQILRLFGESASKMSGLKSNLADARRLLSARHKQLQQQWYRSITLRHVLQLLDQIDAVAKVPSKIEALMASKHYFAAVQQLLQSVSMLEREGIQGVGALTDVRSDLLKLRYALTSKVLEELHAHIYNKGTYSEDVFSARDGDDDRGGQPERDKTAAALRAMRIGGGEDVRAKLAEKVGTASEAGSEVSGPSLRQSLAASKDGTANGGSTGAPGKRQSPPWLEDSVPNEFTESLAASDVPDSVRYIRTMVECLSLLGKISAAQIALNQRLRPTLRDLITQVIQRQATAAEAARPRVDSIPRTHAGGSPLTKGLVAAPGAAAAAAAGRAAAAAAAAMAAASAGAKGAGIGSVAAAAAAAASGMGVKGPMGLSRLPAQELLESVFGVCFKALENHVRVSDLMEAKSSSSADSQELFSPRGIAAEGASAASGKSGPGGFGVKTGGDTSLYNAGIAWNCLQSECQALICDILRASPDGTPLDSGYVASMAFSPSLARFTTGDQLPGGLTPDGGTGMAASPAGGSGAGGLQNGQDPGAPGGDRLTFAFRLTDVAAGLPTGLDGVGGSGVGGGVPIGRGGDGAIHGGKRRVLGSGQESYGSGAVLAERGVYLAPAVYRPVLQFTEKAHHVLPDSQLTSSNATSLRTFLERYISEAFLPRVRTDYRAKIIDALNSPAALKPRGRTSLASYEPTTERGRPVLQGALAAEALVAEVIDCSRALPMYSTQLMEVVQGMLDKVLERCRSAYTEAVLGSLSGTLVGRGDVEDAMCREPAYSSLLTHWVTSSGSGGGGGSLRGSVDMEASISEVEASEVEMFRLLQAQRPVRSEQLLMDMSKVVLLAALSDTLDYLAGSIVALASTGQSVGSPTAPQRRTTMRPPQAGHRRTNSEGPAAAPALPPALASLASKYRSLACECLRTLRLEMGLQAVYQFQGMWARSYVCDTDPEEPDEFVMSLTAQMAAMDDEVSVYVPRVCRNYVFSGVCGLISRSNVVALADMKSIDTMGVRQILRNAIALQQALTNLGNGGEQGALARVQARLDSIRTYYELLTWGVDGVIAFAAEHPSMFTPDEYRALLKVEVPNRPVKIEDLRRLDRVFV